MTKKEKFRYLGSEYSTDAYKTLLHCVYGRELTIEACARTAYRDLQRTLRSIGKMPTKEDYKMDITKQISLATESLLNSNITNKASFDSWHKKTCETLISISERHNLTNWISLGFSYGAAQKWLNMTLKNMIVMELWDEKLLPLLPFLHVPVDNYLLKGAAKLDIHPPKGSKPWSQWDYKLYIWFQEEVRKAVDCPIDWESKAWLESKATQN